MKKIKADPSLAKYCDKTTFTRPYGFQADMNCAEMRAPEAVPSLDDEGNMVSEEYEDDNYFD